jgi:magnesium-transporting ATPase (P-type)
MSVMGYQKRFAIKSADQLKELSTNVKDGIGAGWELLSECAMWNSGARIEEANDEGFTGTANAKLVYNGNVTDQGILKFFAETTGLFEVKKKMTEKDEVLTEIPFDSKNKRATTVFRRSDGTVRVYTKGAPDVLYAKNPEIVEQKTKQEQEANPNLSLLEAKARAQKNSGYGLVRYVAVPGGKADWYDNATNEHQTPDSLDELMRLQGRSG